MGGIGDMQVGGCHLDTTGEGQPEHWGPHGDPTLPPPASCPLLLLLQAQKEGSYLGRPRRETHRIFWSLKVIVIRRRKEIPNLYFFPLIPLIDLLLPLFLINIISYMALASPFLLMNHESHTID